MRGRDDVREAEKEERFAIERAAFLASGLSDEDASRKAALATAIAYGESELAMEIATMTTMTTMTLLAAAQARCRTRTLDMDDVKEAMLCYAEFIEFLAPLAPRSVLVEAWCGDAVPNSYGYAPQATWCLVDAKGVNITRARGLSRAGGGGTWRVRVTATWEAEEDVPEERPVWRGYKARKAFNTLSWRS